MLSWYMEDEGNLLLQWFAPGGVGSWIWGCKPGITESPKESEAALVCPLWRSWECCAPGFDGVAFSWRISFLQKEKMIQLQHLCKNSTVYLTSSELNALFFELICFQGHLKVELSWLLYFPFLYLLFWTNDFSLENKKKGFISVCSG